MKKKLLTLCLVATLLVASVTGATLAYFTDTDDVTNTFAMGKVKIELDEAKVTDDNGTWVAGDERVEENDYSTISIVPGKVFPKDPTIHVEKGSEESYIFLDMTFNKYSSLFWVMAADASADTTTAGLTNFSIFKADGTLEDTYKNANDKFSTTNFVNAMQMQPAVFQAMIGKWFTGIEHEDWELCDIFIGVDKDDVTITDGNYMTLRFAYKGDSVDNEYTVNAKDAADDIDIKFMDTFQMPVSVTQEMIENGTTIGNMKNSFNTEKEAFHLNFKAYAIQAAEITNVDAAYKAMFGTDRPLP